MSFQRGLTVVMNSVLIHRQRKMILSMGADQLKSICIHLRPRISAITSSTLDQFQNFKQQCIANYPRILMVFL